MGFVLNVTEDDGKSHVLNDWLRTVTLARLGRCIMFNKLRFNFARHYPVQNTSSGEFELQLLFVPARFQMYVVHS